MLVVSTVADHSRCSITGAAMVPGSRLMVGLVLGPRRWGEGRGGVEAAVECRLRARPGTEPACENLASQSTAQTLLALDATWE